MTSFRDRGVTILRWLHEAGIETALIDPGKPWQNGADESFNAVSGPRKTFGRAMKRYGHPLARDRTVI